MPLSTPTIAGGATRAISLNEGMTAVGTVAGADADAGATLYYYIVGGADKSKFKINQSTGEITFVAAPDYEKPTDSLKNAAGLTNGSNTYELIVVVEDGPHGDAATNVSATQTITVTVGDVPAVTINGTTGNDTSLGTVGTLATAEDDTINGLEGNDTMNGGVGADIMNGGLGNDIFMVDNIGDKTNENANEGTDTVRSTVSFTLAANVENLDLLGKANISATGNDLANLLTGNTGSNILDGKTGADTMIGGKGADVYRVDSASDIVTELDGEGTDRVEATVSYMLGDFVENLTLVGTATTGTGNALNNVLKGNDVANSLTGLSGNDTLDGGKGIDTLTGNRGNDIYIVDQSGDIVNEVADQGTDTVKAYSTYALDVLTAAGVEKLTLMGTGAISGTGNNADNVITGNSASNSLSGLGGNDKLDGKGGADTMAGGLGNDTYLVDRAEDVVTENSGEGTDTVITTVTGLTLGANVENGTLGGTAGSITGNGLDNVLTGNSSVNSISGGDGNDTINGMLGADTMTGGLGNDIYVVDNSLDSVNEASGLGTGIDTIKSSVTIGALTANVENVELTLLGVINATGNTLDNVMTGNAKNNVLTGLEGNDTLDGGRGYDSLVGGLGDDKYVMSDVNSVNGLSNVWDVITENAAEGTDTVYSTISSATYVLGSNLENLVLNNLAGNFVGNVNGTGNDLANVITGNAGWNILNGAGGNDTIGGGIGADTLIGGLGVDVLTGGADVDIFRWTSTTESGTVAGSIDSITDFHVSNNADKSDAASTGDIINLVDIDARASVVGDQAFVLDTNGALTEGEIMMTRSGNVVTLSIDTDTTAGANMMITITLDNNPAVTGVLSVDNFFL